MVATTLQESAVSEFAGIIAGTVTSLALRPLQDPANAAVATAIAHCVRIVDEQPFNQADFWSACGKAAAAMGPQTEGPHFWTSASCGYMRHREFVVDCSAEPPQVLLSGVSCSVDLVVVLEHTAKIWGVRSKFVTLGSECKAAWAEFASDPTTQEPQWPAKFLETCKCYEDLVGVCEVARPAGTVAWPG